MPRSVGTGSTGTVWSRCGRTSRHRAEVGRWARCGPVIASTTAATERGEGHEGLGAELTPGQADHRATSSLAAGALAARLRAHIGEHQILHADLFDAPGRVEDRLVGAHEQRALPVGVTGLDHLLTGRQSARVPAGSDETAVGGQKPLDLPGHPQAGGDEHDQVVAHPLEVRHQMGGKHDAHPLLGHDLHEALEELPPGQGVETGDRLVEQQQLRALGDGQGEGELGSLAARELAGLLVEVETQRVRSGARPGRRPSRG